ncbi:hypothetical protein FRC16_002248 [Serendipita sp. 398]|nr:hypothetical protein FRC16_002248 [Serendipita sp. 398]
MHTTLVPITIAGIPLALEAYGLHETETVHGAWDPTNPFEGWTQEELAKLQQETILPPIAFLDLDHFFKTFRDTTTARTTPAAPETDASVSRSPSPTSRGGFRTGGTRPMSRSAINNLKTLPVTSKTRKEHRSQYSIPDSGRPMRRQNTLTPSTCSLQAKGWENTLPRDNDGYTHPIVAYRLLTREPKVTTSVLDGLIVPPQDRHVVTSVGGLDTVQCRFSRSLKGESWVVNHDGACNIAIAGFDSYRRHIVQCHLDVPRIPGKTQAQRIDMRLSEMVVARKGSKRTESK